jgi:hypothetical protein
MNTEGYELKQASAVEVGLTKNGKGLRTWFISQFGNDKPTLEHPLVQTAIKANEEIETMFNYDCQTQLDLADALMEEAGESFSFQKMLMAQVHLRNAIEALAKKLCAENSK